MGCFNVSCMLSKLTIYDGDKCYLLPLVPKHVKNEIEPTSQFLYNDDLFNLFCFPIEGTYNDYGSIENIVKTNNTKMIEDYLEISIEDFIACLTDNRKDYFDTYSAFYDTFCEFSDLSENLTITEYLKAIGFKEDGIEFYFPGANYFIKKEKEETFVIYSKKLQILGELNDWNKTDILKIHYKRMNECLGLKNEKAFGLVKKLSCSFVSANILDNLPKKQTLWTYQLDSAYFLKKGFELTDDITFKKNNHEIKLGSRDRIEIDGEKFIFDDKEKFEKYWKSITGESLNRVTSKKEDLTYEDYVYKCKTLLSYKEKKSENTEHLYEMQKMIFKNNFGFREEIPFFLDIYENGLLDVKDEWLLTEKLLYFCYNANILICPTFQGCQCGDLDTELTLSLTVLKSCLKKYLEYEEENIETPESKKFKKLFESLREF